MKKHLKLRASPPARKLRPPLRRSLLLGVLAVLLAAIPILAGSTNHTLRWDTIARGGNAMSSTNYSIKSTAGQSIVGPSTSNGYTLGAGYWYGIREATHILFLPLILRSS